MVQVSVILPNYNHSKFLKERIESILNQTYQNFELIILDDASTDNSLELLNPYKNHEKVSHFIVNPTNSGSPFKQWVKGIALAKGNYIWIAESDDFAETNFLEITYGAIKNDRRASLVYTDSSIIDKQGILKGKWSLNKNEFFNIDKWSKDYCVDGKSELINYLFYKCTINNASAVLFKKSHFNDDKFFDRIIRFKNVGDIYSYMHFALKGHIKYIGLPLNNYRFHNQNTTKINLKNGIIYSERIDCYMEILSRLNINSLSTQEKNKINLACKAIVKKNAFGLIDFSKMNDLVEFVKLVQANKIFSVRETYQYLTLFRFYNIKYLKINRVARKIIKRIS